jgi:hypothetical protein
VALLPGERRGGRQKGTPDRTTAEIKEIAQQFGAGCIMSLAELAGLTDRPGADNPAVQVQALRELLDRGYGKTAQVLSGDIERPLAFEIVWGPAKATEADAANGAIVDAVLTNDDDEDADSITPRIVWDSGAR